MLLLLKNKIPILSGVAGSGDFTEQATL